MAQLDCRIFFNFWRKDAAVPSEPEERRVQARIISDIETILPGSIVIKTDPTYIQGFPDLIVFDGPRWGALEVKRSAKARHRPNQDYYVDLFNEWSFGAFIYPENKEDVLYDLQRSLRPGGDARISFGK